MAICEKCWTDEAFSGNHTVAYEELLKDRSDSPCTPEQQAGDEATICLDCKKKTVHQYIKICMNPECKNGGQTTHE